MNTQKQAYVKGFVKRAAEYGFNENEALDLLKTSIFKAESHNLDGQDDAIDLEDIVGQLREMGAVVDYSALETNTPKLRISFPHSVADLARKHAHVKRASEFDSVLTPENKAKFTEDIMNLVSEENMKNIRDEALKEVHPNLHAAKSFLTQYNIDPEIAGLTLGGAGLLAGGYGLANLLNRKPKNIQNNP
jgi:hypothetical protein